VVPSSILIVAPDPGVAARLQGPLAAAGHRVNVSPSAGSTQEAIAGADVLLVAGLSTDAAAELCRGVKGSAERGGPGVCVLTATDDVEARVALLEAGADEVLVESVDPRELEARVEALITRFRRAPRAGGGTTPAGRPRRSIVVFSPSGGVGTTSIAVNVAIALALGNPGRVALVDLHLPFGQVATLLDLRPVRSILELAADEPALTDPSQLTAYATRHASGLLSYTAPTEWHSRADLAPSAAVALVETATLAHDRVVVDLGSAIDERALAVLLQADAVVLPVRPEIPSLRGLRSLVDVLATRDADLERAVIVLNHTSGPVAMLKPRDVETFLGRSADVEVPYDPTTCVRAVNQGIPVLLSSPTSPAGEAFARIADIAAGDGPRAGPTAAPPALEHRSSGLFGGLFGQRG
jgi:pilus assembly protein CpaE